MNFEEFQASARVMTGSEYENEFGANLTIADLLEDGDLLRVYGDGFWIAALKDGGHLLVLGDDDYLVTSLDGSTLSDLELRLWERLERRSVRWWYQQDHEPVKI